jgi:hypothetical protein
MGYHDVTVTDTTIKMVTNTVPIPAKDDGATTTIECYGCEGPGGTYGILWPLAATNYGA